MRVSVVSAGYFKLDGGAMFGVVPKSMWQKLHPSDNNNLCTWGLNCLLVETADRKILIDTGIGDKQDEKFRSHFHPFGNGLIANLKDIQVDPHDITDVCLTHLHFDHVGGAVTTNSSGTLVPTFPKARYWTNEEHLAWALSPNPREKASFLKENIQPLLDANVLDFFPSSREIPSPWLPNIKIWTVDGHTRAMTLFFIDSEFGKYAYAADLVPSSHHVKLAYTLSYDLDPLRIMEERQFFYDYCLQHGYTIILEHDDLNVAGWIALEGQQHYVWKKLSSTLP